MPLNVSEMLLGIFQDQENEHAYHRKKTDLATMSIILYIPATNDARRYNICLKRFLNPFWVTPVQRQLRSCPLGTSPNGCQESALDCRDACCNATKLCSLSLAEKTRPSANYGAEHGMASLELSMIVSPTAPQLSLNQS